MSTRFTVVVALAAAALALPGLAFGQATATTICKDSTMSAVSGRGACSGHGGVDTKATRAAKKAARARASSAKSAAPAVKSTSRATKASTGMAGAVAAAMVTCKDGSSSKGGRGACRGHGGVNKGATATTGADKAAVPVPSAATSAASPSSSAPSAQPARSAATAVPAARTSHRAAASGTASGKSSTRDNGDPSGAIAQCKDGLYSHATHRKGACSRHGGVAKWMTAGSQ